MAELVLLGFERDDFEQLKQAAAAGDAVALHTLEEMWEDYADCDLACFICDGVTEQPPYSQVLPEPSRPELLVVAPLCAACRELPRLVRWNRSFKILRKMHEAATGRQVHFGVQAPRRQ